MNLLLVGLAALTAAAFAADSSPAQGFPGSWKLISFERTGSNGETTYPLGRDAAGRLTYDTSGRMSVHLMRPGRANFAGIDSRNGTPDEMIAAYGGYTAYYGSYRVDKARGVVIHQVEGSLYPNYIGTGQVRRYTFSGNRLTLEAESPLGRAKLVWERLP